MDLKYLNHEEMNKIIKQFGIAPHSGCRLGTIYHFGKTGVLHYKKALN